jgi:hypothetical protein
MDTETGPATECFAEMELTDWDGSLVTVSARPSDVLLSRSVWTRRSL